MPEFICVDRESFFMFIQDHPKHDTLKRVIEDGYFDLPHKISANDFSEGKEYPESIVAYMTISIKCKYTYYILKDKQ